MIDKKRTILFFVSLIGIVITSLVLVTTYAYQYVQTDYKGENNIGGEDGLNVANLEVSYTVSNKIELSNMPLLPDYKTADYLEFTIDNTKSTGDVAYTISLIDLNYNDKLLNSAFKYTIVRVNEDETHTIINEGDFSSLSGNTFNLLLEENYNGYIENGISEKLRLYLWLKETDIAKELESDISTCNESVQTGCVKFTGKLNITSVFKSDLPTKTLVDVILSDDRIIKNEGTPVFDNIADYKITGDSTSGEIGMYKTEDDYGDSWYFRGAQSYNYVNFAGFMWRIVRINGDGSIRLILDGTLDIANYNGAPLGIVSQFQFPNYNDNAYIGYMYGFTGVTNENVCIITEDGEKRIDESITDSGSCTGEWVSGYDATHMNLNDSMIKDNLDTFYQTYLENKYADYLSDTLFCGDKKLAKNGIGNVDFQIGYGNGTDSETYYSASERLFYESGTSSVIEAEPTLKCAEDESNSYSRYTVKGENTTKGIPTNGNLTYPIALISADEIVYAGGFKGITNTLYYLSDFNKDNVKHNYWWTMTPLRFYSSGNAFVFVSFNLTSLNLSLTLTNNAGVRPVINLRKDILWSYGDGTSGDGAYRVKLPS